MSRAITDILTHINTRANDFHLIRVSSETCGRVHDLALPVSDAYAYRHAGAHALSDDAEILELRRCAFDVV